MKKKWFTYFVYISILFLIIQLIRHDYIIIPERLNYQYLSLSFLLLFAGFLVQGLSYKVILKKYGYKISAKDSLISFGLTVLSRYIPGKFWVHLGRAGYINKHYNYPLNELVYISLNCQFIGIWLVFLFCSFGFITLDISVVMKIIIFSIWILLSFLIFTRYFHKMTQWVVFKTLGKRINLPTLSLKNLFNVFPVFILYWLLYAVAFYVLSLGFTAEIGYVALIYFPLSTIVGIVSLFAPGGIGTREASLVGLFAMGGVTTVLATTISAFSRLWFLAGELFAFVLGMILNVHKNAKTVV